MPWKECSVMDERLQFVARRRAHGGTVQGVWNLSQDRLQDFRSLSTMRRSGIDRQEPPSLSLCPPTSFSGGELYPEREAGAPQLGCSQNPRALDPPVLGHPH